MADSNYEFPLVNDPRLDKAVELWRVFEKAINGLDMTGLIYHGDMDGLIGAAYTRRALLKHLDKAQVKLFWINTEEYDFDSLRQWVKQQRLQKCVFMDVSIENHTASLNHINDQVSGELFIFDHHVIKDDVATKNSKIILANPTPAKLQKGESPVPTFAFAYRLAKEYDLHFPDWLLLLSVFSEGVDSFFSADVEKLLQASFNIQVEGSPRDAYKQTPLPKIGNLVRAEFATTEKDHWALYHIDAVINGTISSAEQLQNQLAYKLERRAAKISEEITKLVDEWKEKISTQFSDKDVIIIPLSTNHAVAGPVASILRGNFPEKIIVTYIKHGDNLVFELRTSNDTHLNLAQILGRVASRVEVINYGGHPMAAGALIKESVRDSFLDELQREVLADM